MGKQALSLVLLKLVQNLAPILQNHAGAGAEVTAVHILQYY